MEVVVHYAMTARPDRGPELGALLLDLAGRLATMPGCQGTRTLVDQANPATFVFIEFWASAESQATAGAALGKAVFGAIMQCLDGPPQMRKLSPVPQAPDASAR
ncbi:putative quinol monooxygenase [Novosphingobium bradum]|uniref:Quinol monooxygenase n=1 Tax=Novosphingobium bradum TaxID=1737444 RepID=A0ABV7IM07_9SPHN